MFIRHCFLIGLSLSVLTLNADPIEDNSFLLEEAYNQEQGVVQFIFKYDYGSTKTGTETTHNTELVFENEIPVAGQDHQFSYSVPYQTLDNLIGEDESGIGDVGLNYRYQLINKEGLAMAPRIGIIMPTGDHKKGLCSGGLGIDFNHAISVEISDALVMHANAGFTWTPTPKDASDEETTATLDPSYGLSLIYHQSDVLDFMMEMRGEGDTLLLAPGFRAAINAGGWQFVPGAAYVQDLTPAEVNSNLIAYLSIEGKMW